MSLLPTGSVLAKVGSCCFALPRPPHHHCGFASGATGWLGASPGRRPSRLCLPRLLAAAGPQRVFTGGCGGLMRRARQSRSPATAPPTPQRGWVPLGSVPGTGERTEGGGRPAPALGRAGGWWPS